MIFDPKKKRSAPKSLSEADIRGRLYGSAVAVSSHVDDQQRSKRPKDEPRSTNMTQFDEEQLRIRQQLDDLKLELEQARKKLDRMRGLHIKRLRSLLILSFTSLLIIILLIIGVRRLFISQGVAGNSAVQSKAVSGALYTVQVAVFGNEPDAQRFTADMKSKGYQAYVKESSYKTGRSKFLVCVGGFDSKLAAGPTLDRLKTKEGIRDSFIIPAEG